jgi:hypothetical protein
MDLSERIRQDPRKEGLRERKKWGGGVNVAGERRGRGLGRDGGTREGAKGKRLIHMWEGSEEI